MRLLLVSLIGAGLVAGGVAAVTAGGQGAGPPSGTLKVTVHVKDSDVRFVDAAPRTRKETPGDSVYGSGLVGGDAKGTVVFEINALGRRDTLHAVFSLAGGKLFVEELAAVGSETVRGAILGGTGAYARARGEFEDKVIKETKSTSDSQITFTFI